MPPAWTTIHVIRLQSCFFKTVQNKMHWAAHGHIAMETVYCGVDASKPDLGM